MGRCAGKPKGLLQSPRRKKNRLQNGVGGGGATEAQGVKSAVPASDTRNPLDSLGWSAFVVA